MDEDSATTETAGEMEAGKIARGEQCCFAPNKCSTTMDLIMQIILMSPSFPPFTLLPLPASFPQADLIPSSFSPRHVCVQEGRVSGGYGKRDRKRESEFARRERG